MPSLQKNGGSHPIWSTLHRFGPGKGCLDKKKKKKKKQKNQNQKKKHPPQKKKKKKKKKPNQSKITLTKNTTSRTQLQELKQNRREHEQWHWTHCFWGVWSHRSNSETSKNRVSPVSTQQHIPPGLWRLTPRFKASTLGISAWLWDERESWASWR